MLKKYRGEIICYYILAAISLVAASFVDLDLDKMLNNPESFFANWFCNTGELPGYLLVPIAGAIVYICSSNKILKLAGVLTSLGGAALTGGYLGDYFFIDNGRATIYGILLGLLFGAGFLYTVSYINVPEKLKKPLIIISISGIIALLVQVGVINIIKFFWGRMRFRAMLAEGSFDGFTQWYIPNTNASSNEFKSFPSGHTAGAGMSYLMMLLPMINEKWKKRKTICFVVPLIYTSIVALTRMIMGAHFLSDVTIGGTVSFTIAICVIAAIEKFQKKLNA